MQGVGVQTPGPGTKNPQATQSNKCFLKKNVDITGGPSFWLPPQGACTLGDTGTANWHDMSLNYSRLFQENPLVCDLNKEQG